MKRVGSVGSVLSVRSVILTSLTALTALTVGCVSPSQITKLESEVRTLRVESARNDSARAAALAAVITLQQRILDSLAAGREALRTLDVRLQGDLTELQRQMFQVQELTGQSQQRLSQLKAQIDARSEQLEASGVSRPATDTASRAPVAPPGMPTADQMYQSARAQQTRGAQTTARIGFQDFLKNYPTHVLVADALFYIGESFGDAAPDSAAVYYKQVLARFKASARASTALYRLGRVEEARGNRTAARAYYDQLIRDYPASDDADLARERLKNLRP